MEMKRIPQNKKLLKILHKWKINISEIDVTNTIIQNNLILFNDVNPTKKKHTHT